jgi:hypothetical protein
MAPVALPGADQGIETGKAKKLTGNFAAPDQGTLKSRTGNAVRQ